MLPRVVSDYLKRIMGAVIPSRMIATFFWIGYLPEWQSHWAAFFTLPLVALILFFLDGFSDSMRMAEIILSTSAVMFCFALVGIYVFQKTVFSDNRYEITIHTAFGQCLMLGLSVPAWIHVTFQISQYNQFLCHRFLNCADWFLGLADQLFGVLVPYFIYRLIDTLKPWPSYWIERDYNNPISNLAEAIFNALYASLLLYLVSFIVFDLGLVEVVEFYKQVFNRLFVSRMGLEML